MSKASPLSSYVSLHTGGSTGDPRQVFHTRYGILQNAGHGERERPLIAPILGRRLGYRETVLISLNSTCEKLQALSRSGTFLPSRLSIRRQYLSILDPPEVNVRLINEFKPEILETFGSYLAMLFSYLAETGVDIPPAAGAAVQQRQPWRQHAPADFRAVWHSRLQRLPGQ